MSAKEAASDHTAQSDESSTPLPSRGRDGKSETTPCGLYLRASRSSGLPERRYRRSRRRQSRRTARYSASTHGVGRPGRQRPGHDGASRSAMSRSTMS